MSADRDRLNREETQRIIEQRKAASLNEQPVGKPFGPDNPDNVAKRDDRPPWERGLRKVRIYEKDIPINDGKLMTAFMTPEKCGVEEKGNKCQLFLQATRVVNQHPVWDSNHVGMTLEPDFNDVRYYVYCHLHGPSPVGPEKW